MKPDAVLPSKHAVPQMAFVCGKQIWHESWSDGVPVRRYLVGKTVIVIETISEMKRPLRLWMKEQGGMY